MSSSPGLSAKGRPGDVALDMVSTELRRPAAAADAANPAAAAESGSRDSSMVYRYMLWSWQIVWVREPKETERA
jgi:hypothetical protein